MRNRCILFAINFRLLGILVALPLVHAARAQVFNVSGTVLDVADGGALPGALVQLINANDTTQRHAVISDGDGHFVFTSVPAGNYRLRADFLGYAQVEQVLKVNADAHELVLHLEASIKELETVEKVAVQSRVEQKGDTTVFNASAYKVNPNTTAEDLLKKMPGFNSRNGSMSAQGEQVKRVLVDGKEFFGDDAALALKNLLAEMIDKVQVFDKPSDQAQFTGFDDGSREKTVNIVTKKGMDHGVYGNAGFGYGTDRRYQGNLSLNWFNGDRRISLLGHSNNINEQSFSVQSIMGLLSGSGGGEGSSTSYIVMGASPGINTTNDIGLNYNDQIGKTEIAGSYFFNAQRGITSSNSERTTYLSDTAAQVTQSGDERTADNFNHRFSFRIETKFDSTNSIIASPELKIQGNTSGNRQLANVARDDGQQLGTTNNAGNADQNGLSFSNSLLFRHRFAKKGRTFSADLTTSLASGKSTGTLLAENHFLLDTGAIASSIDQRSAGNDFTQHHGLQLNYTEPVSANGQLQFTLSPSIQLSDAKKLTYDVDPDTGEELLNSPLSNDADNTVRVLRGGVSYGYHNTGYRFNIGLDGQGSDMHSEQAYPFGFTVDRRYANLLPNAMFRRSWSNTSNLNIFYRTNVNTPSISQLQTVVDNRDPLSLTTGNRYLGQSYQHAVTLQFNTLDSTRTRSFFTYLSMESQPGRISDVTFLPTSDSTLAGGTVLPVGSQLTQPKNLNGYLSAEAYMSYGFPLTALRCNMSLDGGGSVARLPGEVNGVKSLTWNTNWNLGATLSSNINESVDFRVGYTANFNAARNDLRPSLNNSYYQGQLSGEFMLIGLKGWLLMSDMDYLRYNGLGAAYDRNALVWNAAIGHKFLKDDALEFRVSAHDILGRNVDVTRDVGDTYIQNSVTNMLQRYVMCSLRYTLKAFKGGEQGLPLDAIP
jgi:hypothetical protein